MPRALRISSRQHPFVATCRQLARGATDGQVLLDGEHLLEAALDARVPIRGVLAVDPAAALPRRAAAAGATVYEASADAIDAASPVRVPTGIVAVAEWRAQSADRLLTSAVAPALVLGLVDVQDPGNLGAIIRSADALGATGVAGTPGGADPGGWKALRGAMGSTFRLPVARATLEDILAHAGGAGLRVIAASADTGEPLDRIRLIGPVLILLGNEGAGLPRDALAAADATVTIPIRPGANSLNVGVAAALLLYEARRQRQAAARPA